MKIAITAESTIDLPKEILDKYNINIIPFSVFLGDNSYLDGEVLPQQIFDYVKEFKILPKTSAINEFIYEEFFNKIKKNYDAIIHFSLSGEISSSCQNAKNVAARLKNVFVIDTKSLSTGIALLALFAKRLVDKGESVEEVFNKTILKIKDVQASFVLDRLDFLYKGGRCNSVQLMSSNLLKIKPEIDVVDGKMGVTKKYFGKINNAIKNYVDGLLKKHTNPDLSNVFITYSSITDDSILEYLTAVLKKRGFKNIFITTAGSTITSHCGENCLGVIFLNAGKEK